MNIRDLPDIYDQLFYCMSGNAELLATLIKEDPSLDLDAQDDEGRTFLSTACLVDNLDAVQVLLKAKVDTNIADNKGFTALMHATQDEEHMILDALIAAKADLNMKDHDGNTALSFAVIRGKCDSVKSLLEAKAALTVEKNSIPLLHVAVWNENIELIKLLAKVNPNVEDEKSHTALDHAVSVCSIDVVNALIEAGADVNKVSNNMRCTPLMNAANYRKIDCAQALIKAKADVNIRTPDRMTALHYAALACAPEIIKVLLDANADPCVSTKKFGLTPLDFAGDSEECRKLLKAAQPGLFSCFFRPQPKPHATTELEVKPVQTMTANI